MLEKFTHTDSPKLEKQSVPGPESESPIRNEILKVLDSSKSETADAILALDDTHLELFDHDFFNAFGELYNVLMFGSDFDVQGAPELIAEYGQVSPYNLEARKDLAKKIRKIIQ